LIPEPNMNRIVYVLNGPNLNLLGKRQPHIYGHETLAAVEADCRKVAGEFGLDLRFHQSNREYEIIDWIHEAREVACDQSCRIHPHVGCNPRRANYLSAADHRGSHLERPQARGIS